MSGMPRRARVVTWNGQDLPPELRELPAGRYIVEAVEERRRSSRPRKRRVSRPRSSLELERAGLTLEHARELGIPIDTGRTSGVGANVMRLRQLMALR